MLSVACYDLGEYVRHYPRGKAVLDQLEGKKYLLKHMVEEGQPDVKYNALIAVQKLMTQNWCVAMSCGTRSVALHMA